MINSVEDVADFLGHLAHDRDEDYVARLHTILSENIMRGRLTWYLALSDDNTFAGYVEKVIRQYDTECELIDALKIHKDISTWVSVQQEVLEIAYRLLWRKGFVHDVCKLVSEDITQDVCLKILFAHYPYDSEFIAWITQITNYTGYKYMKRRWIDDDKNTDIEKLQYISHEDRSKTDFLEVELQVSKKELNEAIQQLSLFQQEVILGHYIMKKPLAEIAEALDISPNTLYKRHYDALKNLGKILGKKAIR